LSFTVAKKRGDGVLYDEHLAEEREEEERDCEVDWPAHWPLPR
jgi:hypothetical protein